MTALSAPTPREAQQLVGEWLLRTSRHHPHKIALRCGDAQLSYRALARRAAQVANLWHAGLALTPGTRVALLAPNAIEHAELYVGGALAGVVTVPLNFRLAARELTQIVTDAGARVIVAAERFRSTVEAIVSAGFDGRVLFLGPEWERVLSAAATSAPAVQGIVPSTPFLQIYTSGTTGAPKGALISHRNVGAFAWTHEAEGNARFEDVHVAATPLCFLAPAARLFLNIHVGATSVLLSEFDPEAMTRLLRSGDVSTAMVVPAMLKMLNEHQREPVASARFRLMMYGGSPMPRAVIDEALVRFRAGFYQGYGLTETLTLTSLRPEEHVGERLGSVGRAALGVDVRVVDDAGADVATGAVGEIIARGGGVMESYFNNDAATAEVLRGGWAFTGDLATIDEDGFIFIVDRKKEMLISGGINVYPREIEVQLEQHALVAEAAVVGQPDDKWGEVPVAFVRLGAPSPAPSDLPAQLEAHLRDRLAKFKVPRRYIFVEALPKNASGKVLKRALQDQLKGEPKGVRTASAGDA